MIIRLKDVTHGLVLAAGALSASGITAHAQFLGPAITSTTGTAKVPTPVLKPEFTDVRIAPGDVISIVTFGAPELTTSSQTTTGSILGPSNGMVDGVKVGPKGEITLPYLGTVVLAGMTPSEVAVYLRNALKEGGFLSDPQVTVQLIDSPTRVISVIGEVLRPAPVEAFGQIRLLDAISACGGVTPLASHMITIRRIGEPNPITVELNADPNASNLSDIPLMPGDTVIVPKVGDVFVVGEIKMPSAIPLAGNTPITVARAIALAGGVNFGAALSQARIIRTTTGNQKVEIKLDLKKILYGKQQDVALLSDDILFVPMNGFKAAVGNGAASIAATLLYGVTYTAATLK